MSSFVPQPIEDVQNRVDTRGIVIQKVGIKSLTLPIIFTDADHSQPTIATFDLSVNLAAHLKGTHMSRFVDLVHGLEGKLSVERLKKLLNTMLDKLQAQQGYIDVSFPFFRMKQAPITAVSSQLDYRVTLHGEIHRQMTALNYTFIVPVTSLCPCSKEISEYGAHNQRSYITAKVASQETLSLSHFIALIEQQGSCEIYANLKRPDEKHVTEKAYENPKFVEDIVRDLALVLQKDSRILSYVIEAENHESIHNHSAYARIVSS